MKFSIEKIISVRLPGWQRLRSVIYYYRLLQTINRRKRTTGANGKHLRPNCLGITSLNYHNYSDEAEQNACNPQHWQTFFQYDCGVYLKWGYGHSGRKRITDSPRPDACHFVKAVQKKMVALIILPVIKKVSSIQSQAKRFFAKQRVTHPRCKPCPAKSASCHKSARSEGFFLNTIGWQIVAGLIQSGQERSYNSVVKPLTTLFSGTILRLFLPRQSHQRCWKQQKQQPTSLTLEHGTENMAIPIINGITNALWHIAQINPFGPSFIALFISKKM